jgi:ubiquinol-cytochrome c reductase cytochrome b subunit
VHDLFGVSVFLTIFSAVVFFAPEMGGYFLEYNNFLPGDSEDPAAHRADLVLHAFYSVLRATTADFMWVLMFFVAAYVVFIWLKSRLATRSEPPSP